MADACCVSCGCGCRGNGGVDVFAGVRLSAAQAVAAARMLCPEDPWLIVGARLPSPAFPPLTMSDSLELAYIQECRKLCGRVPLWGV